MTNMITDPTGVLWLATSDLGYYWSGFSVGLFIFGFGLIFRMARGTGKTTPDF
jgi:hypothetical protein